MIAATWGLNFTIIRFGLDELTPFAFAGWRFVLGALPALVLPRPKVSWKVLLGMAVFLFTGQFVLLFLAMQAGLPPDCLPCWSSCTARSPSCSRRSSSASAPRKDNGWG